MDATKTELVYLASIAESLRMIAESCKDGAMWLHAIDAKLCTIAPAVRDTAASVASIDAKTKAPTVSVFTRDPDMVSAKSAAAKLQADSTTANPNAATREA